MSEMTLQGTVLACFPDILLWWTRLHNLFRSTILLIFETPELWETIGTNKNIFQIEEFHRIFFLNKNPAVNVSLVSPGVFVFNCHPFHIPRVQCEGCLRSGRCGLCSLLLLFIHLEGNKYNVGHDTTPFSFWNFPESDLKTIGKNNL